MHMTSSLEEMCESLGMILCYTLERNDPSLHLVYRIIWFDRLLLGLIG
jgi:hypothetical protein